MNRRTLLKRFSLALLASRVPIAFESPAVAAESVSPAVLPSLTGSVGAGRTLIASGGLCAPLAPFYDIPDFAVTERPVRDALPSFMAEQTRGR